MKRSLVMFFLIAAVVPAALQAHRIPEGLTTVSQNERTGNIEIAHRLFVHDAEQGLAKILQLPDFTMGSIESQARVALYVEQHFVIIDETSGDALPLMLLGAKLSGDQVLVFQESTATLPRRISVRNDVLREALPDQVNVVNFDLGGAIRTLVFSGDDEWKDLQFASETYSRIPSRPTKNE